MIYSTDIQHRYTATIYSTDIQHRYTAPIYSNDIQQRYTATIYSNDIQQRYTTPIYSNDIQHRYTATIYSNDIQQRYTASTKRNDIKSVKRLIVMYLLILIAISQYLIQANELNNSHFRVFIFVLPVSDIGSLVFILKLRNTEMYIFIKYKIET